MDYMTNQPMYIKIKQDIMDQIESKILQPGDRLPTEQQLMAQYQVSRITVSRAMSELKSEGLVERFPNRGTFVSRAVPVSPMIYEAEVPPSDTTPDERVSEIACIIPSIRDFFSLSILNGVLSALPENDYLCHIFQSINPQRENYLLKRCLEMKMAGIVLFPQDQPFFSKELLTMQLNQYPLVLMDRYLPRLDTSYVISDNQAAGGLCLRHLHELGHQRIAFITSSNCDTFSVKRRISGIQEMASQLHMPEDAIHIVDDLKYFDKAKHYEDFLLNLIKRDRVTAFIASENNICSYLYRTFSDFHLKVPGDVSLMTFDQPIVDNLPANFFTHINQSEFLMGQEAGAILRRSIESHDTNFYHRVITPRLEIQRSTGPAML